MILRSLRSRWASIAFATVALALVAWVAWDAAGPRLIAWSPTSDYWEHTAVLHALLEDPWHPKHPLIAGDVASPRFGPHFLSIALAGRVLGLDALGAASLAAVIDAALLVVGIYLFFKEYFRNELAPLVALVVIFGSWLDAPHFSNVFKLRVFFSVACYPSTAAFAVMLIGSFVVLRLVRSAAERPGLWAASACLFAYAYVTHPLTAMAAFTAGFLLCTTEPGVSTERRLWAAAALIAGILLASLWPYYPALGMVARGTAERIQTAIDSGGEQELHRFYEIDSLVQILGFCLLVLPFIPYFVWKRRHLVVPLGSAAMLLVFTASAFVDIPLGHRFILLGAFFLQIGLVWLLLAVLPPFAPTVSRRTFRYAARVGLAAAGLASLVYMALSTVSDAWEKFDGKRDSDYSRSPTVRYGKRVAELAGPNAVVLARPVPSWPLPTFGPKIVTLHHRNPLIRDAAERNRDGARFLSGAASDEERRRILARYGVTHVITLPEESKQALHFLRAHGRRQSLPLGRQLFDVREAAP
jgi:hypothetical protein